MEMTEGFLNAYELFIFFVDGYSESLPLLYTPFVHVPLQLWECLLISKNLVIFLLLVIY